MSDQRVWASVRGQEAAVALLQRSVAHPVHAYLFVGPEGAGSLRAALIFAGELLARHDSSGTADEAERHRRLASAGTHPAISIVRRVGASLTRDQVREVVRQAEMAPAEGAHQVLILTEFHLVADAAPMLLKTLEEPPPSTTFLILADEVTPELATISSRCVRVDVPPLPVQTLVELLIEEGIDQAQAVSAAAIAGGDLDKARLFASDPNNAQRRARWTELPYRLDGSGSEASRAVTDVLADVDEALEHVDTGHAAEVDRARETAEQYGTTQAAVKDLADRQKRERRRMRLELLSAGVSAVVDEYRRMGLSAGSERSFVTCANAAQRWATSQANNPREDLALLRFFMQLPPAGRPGK